MGGLRPLLHTPSLSRTPTPTPTLSTLPILLFSPPPAPPQVLRLYAGQYFGERALLTSAKRAANVVASGRVTLLAISRGRFEAVFGPLQDVIDAEAAWKEAVAMQREVLSRKTMASGLQVRRQGRGRGRGREAG